ncbi:unnamed protein product [Sphacelaria rigidula]
MTCPEEVTEVFNGGRGTGGTGIEDLDKMKLAELKVLYKERGGKPRAMRKSELIQKLTDSFLLAGQQPQQQHDGREGDDGRLVHAVDQGSRAVEAPIASATAVAASFGGETVTTASASPRNIKLSAEAETGAGGVGHVKHKGAAERLNGHIVAADGSGNLRSQNDLVASNAAVVSGESGAVGRGAFPAGAGIVGSITTSSASRTTTRASLTPPLSPTDALDPVTSRSLHESAPLSPRLPSSARRASATTEEHGVGYGLHDIQPAGAGARG